MAVGRSGHGHSASNKELSAFELRCGAKTMKHRLLVVKYTRNHCADCLCPPILHHLHPIGQSGGIYGEFDGGLGRRGHVLGYEVLEEECWGLGHQENASIVVACLHI